MSCGSSLFAELTTDWFPVYKGVNQVHVTRKHCLQYILKASLLEWVFKNIFLFAQPKHMLYVLNRTVSFEDSKQMLNLMDKNIYNFALNNLVYLDYEIYSCYHSNMYNLKDL